MLILASAMAGGQAWPYADQSVVSGPMLMWAGRNNTVLHANLVLTIVWERRVQGWGCVAETTQV